MIVSWNIRGLNKMANNREIGFRLRDLQFDFDVLTETGVNKGKKSHKN